MTKTYVRWYKPAPATSNEKIDSLRKGLFWTYGVVQAAFLSYVAYIYIAAEVEKNGEPFHDLGVYVGREVILNEVTGIWMWASVGLAAVFFAGYRAMKARWAR